MCGDWFSHMREWWAKNDLPNVLFLQFEALKEVFKFCHENEFITFIEI
jgi:hypothetical protein